jgi:hypothetical protein
MENATTNVVEKVAAAAILAPGATAQVIESANGIALHLAVDRSGEAKTILLNADETQTLMNMLLQYAQSQVQAVETTETPES